MNGTENWLTGERDRIGKLNDVVVADEAMAQDLREYVESNTSLSSAENQRIDYQREVDGYLHTAVRFESENNNKISIGVYGNRHRALVCVERYRNSTHYEPVNEQAVCHDDDKTLASVIEEMLADYRNS